MKYLVFIDIDGTLTYFEHIPPSAIEAIQKARQNGHKVFINTGRVRSEMHGELLDLETDGYCLSSGTEIWIGYNRVHFMPMENEIVHRIQEHMTSLHIGYTLEGSRVCFTDNISRRIFKQLYSQDNRRILTQKRSLLPSVSDMDPEDYNQIMQIQLNHYGILNEDIILESLPEHLIWTTYSRTGGNITDSRYSKGTSIEFVKNRFPGYQTIAIGDADNDLTMLKAADISIGMGNGSPRVKEEVDFVTTHVNNKGLYNAFDHFGLL